MLRHTSLAKELTLLDKIIFAADKLADGRKFEGIQLVRETIATDFDKGFKMTVKAYLDQLKSERDITPEQEEIFRR